MALVRPGGRVRLDHGLPILRIYFHPSNAPEEIIKLLCLLRVFKGRCRILAISAVWIKLPADALVHRFLVRGRATMLGLEPDVPGPILRFKVEIGRASCRERV